MIKPEYLLLPSASKEAYKNNFFPQTIRGWNDLPDSLISSAEMSDDCVSCESQGLISLLAYSLV